MGGPIFAEAWYSCLAGPQGKPQQFAASSKSAAMTLSFHLVKNMCYFPLWGFKGNLSLQANGGVPRQAHGICGGCLTLAGPCQDTGHLALGDQARGGQFKALPAIQVKPD